MPENDFHELLGDDGEFKDAVDTDFGVYSVYRRSYLVLWRVSAVMLSLFVCAIIAGVWYF